MKLLPFWLMPGSWGLKGKTRDIAKAEYELNGYERDAKVAEIKYADEPKVLARQLVKIKHKHRKLTDYQYDVELAMLKPEDVREQELLDVELKWGKINQYDYDVKCAEKKLAGVDLELRKLEIEYEHGKIDEQQLAKMSATARGEPYIAVVNSTYDPALKLSGVEFEFDWNHLWIEQLIAAGYIGSTEEQLIQRWFEDLCRTVVLEGAENEPIPFNSRRAATRTVHQNGPTDYS